MFSNIVFYIKNYINNNTKNLNFGMNHGKNGLISIYSQGRDMGFDCISTFIQRFLQNSEIPGFLA